LIAELAASLKSEGRTLLDRLDEIAATHGVYVTAQVSLRVEELSVISRLMADLRAAPPHELLGETVSTVDDLAPDADVIRLVAKNVRVVVRPSGTEPKAKAYIEVCSPPCPAGASAEQWQKMCSEVDNWTKRVADDFLLKVKQLVGIEIKQ